MKQASSRKDTEVRIFDSFEEAEEHERREWMAMPRQQRMILLEALRLQTYPDERIAPQGLQRVLAIID